MTEGERRRMTWAFFSFSVVPTPISHFGDCWNPNYGLIAVPLEIEGERDREKEGEREREKEGSPFKTEKREREKEKKALLFPMVSV
jgi:hypothetical protein